MASKRIFDLPETKGEWQMRGNISGVEKKTFFTNKKTKGGFDMNMLNFGVEFDDKQTAYIVLNGMEKKSVYYYNSKDKKTKEVAWKDRSKAPGEGYRLIGVNVGLKRDEEEDVNIKYNLTEYDAAKYASENLEDGMPVFLRGSLEFDSYTNDKGEVKKSRKFIPNQISRCGKPIEFDSDEFEALADFKTTLVFEGIDKERDDAGKDTGRFVLSALVVGYSNIVSTEFIIESADLATKIKKNLKPYNSIEVTGKFQSTILVDAVEETDDWGEKSSFDRISAPRKLELIITGAKPSTLDRETYSEQNVADAMRAIKNKDNAEKNFGDTKKVDDAHWDDDEMEDEWD